MVYVQDINGKPMMPTTRHVRRGKSLRDAAVMGIMKWRLYEELKSKYDNISMTFGYVTKYNRIKHGIEKSHVCMFPIGQKEDINIAEDILRTHAKPTYFEIYICANRQFSYWFE